SIRPAEPAGCGVPSLRGGDPADDRRAERAARSPTALASASAVGRAKRGTHGIRSLGVALNRDTLLAWYLEPVLTGGTEWIVDAFGCDAERLRDAAALRRVCDGVVAAL